MNVARWTGPVEPAENGGFVAVADYNAVLADAMRYRGLRAIATEPDEAMQDRFTDALEALPLELDGSQTPDEFDTYADAAIATCDAVRKCS